MTPLTKSLIGMLRRRRCLLNGLRVFFCALACWAAAALVGAPAALAVIDDTAGEDDGEGGACGLPRLTFKLEANLVPVGLPIAGSGLQINATTAKLVGRRLSSSGGISCPVLYFRVPKFEWKIAGVPAGQSTSISFARTLLPIVNLGGSGAYRIRLVACPKKCLLTADGRSKSVGPFSRDVVINAVSQMAVPHETEPLLPALAPPVPPLRRYTFEERDELCQGGGGAASPQWVVPELFRASSYRLVEGEVEASKVSPQDNFLNHDSQDHNWEVHPDPPYFGLPQPSISGGMEMEWEVGSFPAQVRPTAGDRASTLGFWIFDCGHDPFKTEIHPPVGVGVERARAVEIPPSFRPAGFPNGMGSNVLVPGIVTDLWFNRRSGEITRNCSTSGLAQPPVGFLSGNCIQEPHAVDGKFTFKVYLPRDPRLRALEAGLNPPPVPLFVGIEPIAGLPSGGPDPTIAVKQQDSATWLEVTVDLTGVPGLAYARRVSAAWAYAQPQNWGALRWKVRLNKLVIGDDSEVEGDDGDWRFFFNTNNRDREWTRVFSCDGCIDDPETVPLNASTGSGQRLGPDPVLFPGQKIIVHTGGFDEEVWGDDIGRVFDRNPQVSREYFTSSQGNEGSYRLEYRVFAGLPVGNATLTPEAQALLATYTARSQPQCVVSRAQSSAAPSQVPPRAQCGPVAQARKEPNLTVAWHPDGIVPGKSVQRSKNFEIFKTEREKYTLQGISVAGLKSVFNRLRARDPKRLNATLAEMREELARVPARLRDDYSELVATLDKALPSEFVRRALPPGFRKDLKSLKILSRR